MGWKKHKTTLGDCWKFYLFNFEKEDHIMHTPEYDVNISRLCRVSL